MSKHRPIRARDISELSDEALRCVLYRRHSFPLPVYVPTYLDNDPALRADVKCDCGTRKVMYIAPRSFEEWSTFYVWPNGFLVEGGRPDKIEATKESLRRQTEGQVQHARQEQRTYDLAEVHGLRMVS